KGLRLITYVDPALPALVIGDAVRLRQILVNLIGNAVKFTEQGDIIVVAESAGTRHGWVSVRFAVRDQGIGISPEGKHKLFNAFSQAESSTTRKYGGTGLGLSICQRLAEMMGGKIEVESEEGKGSEFHFTIHCEVAEQAGELTAE